MQYLLGCLRIELNRYHYNRHHKIQQSTLHIKIRPELAEGLKVLSRKRDISVGELVRKAVVSCYQSELLDLGERQRRAVEAYRGGYISLGKLAEEMGMNVMQMRNGIVLTDDRAARMICNQLKIPFSGTIGILKAPFLMDRLS
jgi:hypothetical protein